MGKKFLLIFHHPFFDFFLILLLIFSHPFVDFFLIFFADFSNQCSQIFFQNLLIFYANAHLSEPDFGFL